MFISLITNPRNRNFAKLCLLNLLSVLLRTVKILRNLWNRLFSVVCSGANKQDRHEQYRILFFRCLCLCDTSYKWHIAHNYSHSSSFTGFYKAVITQSRNNRSIVVKCLRTLVPLKSSCSYAYVQNWFTIWADICTINQSRSRMSVSKFRHPHIFLNSISVSLFSDNTNGTFHGLIRVVNTISKSANWMTARCHAVAYNRKTLP